MAQIIDLNDYKLSKELENNSDRVMQQREFFINFYGFLNRNLNNEFDEVLMEFDDMFIDMVLKHGMNRMVVNYFHIPMVTFMVTVFIKNSDLAVHFPELASIENDDNQLMFKNTLFRIITAYSQDDHINFNEIELEMDLNRIIRRFYVSLLTIIPQKIVLI
ncbi:hypothetical protein [Alkaliphilus crotonatoxidans]